MSIKVYSKPVCMQCSATKRELERRGIAFEEIDLTKDAAALRRIIDLGYMQAPVVEADGEHWSGFRPDRIAALQVAEMVLVS